MRKYICGICGEENETDGIDTYLILINNNNLTYISTINCKQYKFLGISSPHLLFESQLNIRFNIMFIMRSHT